MSSLEKELSEEEFCSVGVTFVESEEESSASEEDAECGDSADEGENVADQSTCGDSHEPGMGLG